MTIVDLDAPIGEFPLLAGRLVRLTVLAVAALAGQSCGTDSPSSSGPVPTTLSFTVQPPPTVWAGAVMVPAVRAAVLDNQGNTATAFTGTISIAITSGTGSPGATLSGTLERAVVNGVATFDDLAIDRAAAGYTLTVQAGNLASSTSAGFTVEPGAAVELALATQPGPVTAGSPITLEVGVRDAFGNTVTGSTSVIAVAISPGTGVAGAVLGGTLTRSPVNGIATFDDLTINRAGVGYRLTLTAADIESLTTNSFTVNTGPPSRLVLTNPYPTATAGYRVAPIRATVVDEQGNTISGSTAAISIAITDGTGTGGAALSGTLSQPAVGGVATFADLSIDQPGTGYSLTATSAGLIGATTDSFSVTEWPVAPTLISLESDGGDFVGGGQAYQYTNADAVISGAATDGHFSLRIDGDQWWHADFQAPSSIAQLTPGLYDGLTRYPFHDPGVGGLTWGGEGRGCNTLTGWFAVDRVAYDGAVFFGIDLRFEQHCEGSPPALRGTIHWDANDPTTPPGPVYPIPTGLWAPAVGSTPPTGDYVYLKSDVGDYIGQGRVFTYTPATATIAASAQGGRLSVDVAGWFAQFQAMNTLTRLQPGYYGDLRRYPFHNPTKGGLSWSGQGRGCNKLMGWFAVDAITYQDDQLTAIDLRFEQHCEGGTPALHGAIRWTR